MNSTIKSKTGKCIDCLPDAPDKPLIADRCQFHYKLYRAKVNAERNAGRVHGCSVLKAEIKETISVAAAVGAAGVDSLKSALESIRPQVDILGIEGMRGIYKQLLQNTEPVSQEDVSNMAKDMFNYGVKPTLQTTRPLPRRKPKKKPTHPWPKKPSGTEAWYEYHISTCKWKCMECDTYLYYTNERGGYACQAHILPKKEKYGFPSVKNVLENHLLLGSGKSCGCHNAFDASWERASRMKVFPLAYKIVTEKLIHLLSPEELSRLPEVFTKPLPEL